MTAVRSTGAKLAVAGSVPIAVSAAWMPLRDHLPNTDLALILVLVAGTIGWLANTRAAVLAAMTGALAFDVMDTCPYGALTISRATDVATALVLLATGVLVGAGAARLARYHRSEDDRSDALAVVMEASGLVATGEEQQLVAGALGSELRRAMDLVACDFYPQPPSGTRPAVARDGSLVGLLDSQRPLRQIDLPVWCQGEVVAHYRLTLGDKSPSQQELRLALSLADQAGAAMANSPPQPPPEQPGRLRLLSSGSAPRSARPTTAAAKPERSSGKSGRHANQVPKDPLAATS